MLGIVNLPFGESEEKALAFRGLSGCIPAQSLYNARFRSIPAGS